MEEENVDQPGPSSARPMENGHTKHKKHRKRSLQAALANAEVGDADEERHNRPDFEEAMERRAAINNYSRKFGDNVQKLQRGMDADITVDEVVASIEQIDADQLVSGKDMTADAVMIHNAAQVLAAQSGELRGARGARFDVNIFASRVKDYANREDPTVDPFVAIGNKFSHLLNKPPEFDYMRPSMAVQQGHQFKPKKEREGAKQQRNKDAVIELHGQTAKQAVEGEPDKSVTKQLDNLRKCLRNVLKQRNTNSIGYYDFILHPINFNDSVDNAFHFSFLVKDGYARLTVGEDSPMPVIELVPKHERQQYQQNDRSTIETMQAISRLDMHMWETFVELLNIREPLITKPTE
ncbi:non-structural maintenance of chromosomes element 4 A [Aphelenchoides avenae]|nr:non-structural maintenance of chromosomes element 4 A [Aphelenchus avenae]